MPEAKYYSCVADRWWRATPGAAFWLWWLGPAGVYGLFGITFVVLGLMSCIMIVDAVDVVLGLRHGVVVKWAAVNVVLSLAALSLIAVRLL